jgi:hypothetical protein
MRILIKREDGGVSIMHMPLPPLIEGDESTRLSPEQIDAMIAGEVAKWATSNAGYVSHQVIDPADIPRDRTFRDAWGHDLKVDMPKAREIHKQHLRELRAPLLAAADIEYMLALEAGVIAQQRAVALRKQALRDVTAHPAIAAAKTPDELKAAIPDVLR